MIYYYDLHIHTTLSPCADCLMTPNNICNMAMLKGLDLIAVTDHNSMKQLAVIHALSKSYDFLFVPGVEVTVSEGIDILVYFKYVDDALLIDKVLSTHLADKPLDETLYGEQALYDIDDQKTGDFNTLLIQPLRISATELFELLAPYETIQVLAHIERVPASLHDLIYSKHIDAIETKSAFMKIDKPILHNSDAHQIIDILERTKENQINLKNLTIDDFFDYFKS